MRLRSRGPFWAIRPLTPLVAAALALVPRAATAATLTVGPGQTYPTPCAAIAAASPGDTVLVSPGTASYTDTCEIGVAGLTLKGVGGQPTIDLSGTQDPANDKGIYDVTADDVTIDNLELTGANVSVANGANGAGIRDEASGLVVLNCYIHDNQDGILATAANAGSSLTVEYTQFNHNGLGAGCDNGGCTHNIYVGTGAGGDYATFVFAFNWSHDIADDMPDKGHLVKTRAQNNYILYNALLGETGHDSIELDIPNGGFSVVVGNILEKGPNCDDNPNLLSYGEEGLSNPDTSLYVASNTFVSDYTSSATFINVAAGGTLTAHDNLFQGPGTAASTGALSSDNLAPTNPMFASPSTYDYHLLAGSPAIGQGVSAGSANGFSLTPTFEYVQPIESVARLMGAKLDVGAFQYGTVVAGAGQTSTVGVGDAGTPTLSDAGSLPPTGDGGATKLPGSDGGSAPTKDAGVTAKDAGAREDASTAAHDASTSSSGSSGGCSCWLGDRRDARNGASDAWLALGAAGLLVTTRGRKRRQKR